MGSTAWPPCVFLKKLPPWPGSSAGSPVVVVTRSARLTCVGLRQGAKPQDRPLWQLVAQSTQDDKELWRQALPAEPVRWGTAVDAQGRTLVSLRNGQLLCFGEKP